MRSFDAFRHPTPKVLEGANFRGKGGAKATPSEHLVESLGDGLCRRRAGCPSMNGQRMPRSTRQPVDWRAYAISSQLLCNNVAAAGGDARAHFPRT
jgi:hypothetical protein